MRVAVALFGEEISPRFDCCGALAFADSEQSFETAEVIRFNGPDGERRLIVLRERGATALLCGGIRRCDWFRLGGMGVKVFSGLSGRAGEAYRSFLAGRLTMESFPVRPSFDCPRRARRMGKENGG